MVTPIRRSGFGRLDESETQAVFVPLDFRLRSFDVRATVHIGRREKPKRFLRQSKNRRTTWARRRRPSGEISTEEMALGVGFRIQQEASNGGRGLKTTKVQAFGGSNPSPSVSDSSPMPCAGLP